MMYYRGDFQFHDVGLYPNIDEDNIKNYNNIQVIIMIRHNDYFIIELSSNKQYQKTPNEKECLIIGFIAS